MGLNYLDLDERTRKSMVQEITMDIKAGKMYLSSYLSQTGIADWPGLLLEAAESADDTWFGEQLRQNGRLNTTAQRRKPKGGYATVRVPVTAHETLSEGRVRQVLYSWALPSCH